MRRLVLASASRYRAAQLTDLRYPFVQRGQTIDETLVEGETAESAVARLTQAKCRAALSAANPGEIVLAGDQLGECRGRILRKPGSVEAAVAQLRSISGATVQFFSGAAIGYDDQVITTMAVTRLKVRALSDALCERYVAADDPIDCAGAFKIESLGLLLFEQVSADDPTALIGLPMLWVIKQLAELGVEPRLD